MNRRRFLQVAGGVTGLGLGAVAYGGFVERHWVEFTSQPLPRGRGEVAPVGGVAHLTDLHLKGIDREHDVIAAEIARRAPDVVVITGDAVDYRLDLPILEDFLALLPYGIPKYAILGNWEHWGRVDLTRLEAIYERANGTLLVNRSVEQRTPAGLLRITGLDDLVGGSPDLAVLSQATGGADLHLVLAHCPAQRDLLPVGDVAVDLVLSGHTHGGQVKLLGYAPRLPRGSGGYLEGWYVDGGPPLYVARGVGTSLLPIRFGARPEVVFFEGGGAVQHSR